MHGGPEVVGHAATGTHGPRLATAADLDGLSALLASLGREEGMNVITRALVMASARVVVHSSPDGMVEGVLVVHDLDGPHGEARVLLYGGEGRKGLIADAARLVGDMGCDVLVDDDGTRHVVPESGGSLAARFIRLAARAANAANLAAATTAGIGTTHTKDDGSISAAADAAADTDAAAILADLGVPMLSEERADVALDDPTAPWLVVDPIDGTGNYRAGLPPWAFAAGLVQDGRPLAGYVMDLSSGRRWWGVVGAGAFRDGHRIEPQAGATLIVPTPPTGAAATVPDGYRRIRITGCTAIDLCLVADGSAGAWHDLDRDGTHVHDVAGALGVLAAAGGVVRDPSGAELPLPPDTAGLIRFVAAADAPSADHLVAWHRR
ncbi:hypothetical protein BH23ACT9_BH23ACT9_15160 [soil metagenome]